MTLDCVNYDLDQVRRGSTFITNNADIGWANVSMEFEKKCAAVYQDAYPAKYHRFPIIDGG